MTEEGTKVLERGLECDHSTQGRKTISKKSLMILNAVGARVPWCLSSDSKGGGGVKLQAVK